MFKIEEIPFWAWITFMLIYSVIGNPDDNNWSGSYFMMQNSILIWAFLIPKTPRIKIAGVCMASAILVFCIIKFFLYPEIERFCIFILFLIVLLINIYLQIKRK